MHRDTILFRSLLLGAVTLGACTGSRDGTPVRSSAADTIDGDAAVAAPDPAAVDPSAATLPAPDAGAPLAPSTDPSTQASLAPDAGGTDVCVYSDAGPDLNAYACVGEATAIENGT
jgi:hypothetical protein